MRASGHSQYLYEVNPAHGDMLLGPKGKGAGKAQTGAARPNVTPNASGRAQPVTATRRRPEGVQCR